MRERLGIPNPAGNRWTAEGPALLGTLPDREVARRLGRSLSSVTQKRCQLGIPNPFDERRRGGSSASAQARHPNPFDKRRRGRSSACAPRRPEGGQGD
jgi:hypothetical protein